MSDETVLLIDDEVDFTAALAKRMKGRGLAVETATSGEEAIDKVRARDFDAVILDLVMPEMDGMQTLKALLDVNPDLQVVLLTGHASVKKGVEAVKQGALDVLTKPADMQSLLDRVREAKNKKLLLLEKRSAAKVDEILKSKGW